MEGGILELVYDDFRLPVVEEITEKFLRSGMEFQVQDFEFKSLMPYLVKGFADIPQD